VEARITDSFPVVPACAVAQQCIESGHETLKAPDSAGPAYGTEVVVGTRDVVAILVAGFDVVATSALAAGNDVLAAGPARCGDEEHPVAPERVSMITQTDTPTTLRLTDSASFLCR
jgi:hypothetical protein